LEYPEFIIGSMPWVVTVVPYIAFLVAAFSAVRLAKFNLDTRQTTSFIGLPTPANALFWGSLVVGFGEQLSATPYYIYIVLALVLLSSYLLVAELPLFALKFKHWGWRGNEVKYIFVATSVLILALLQVRGIAVVIAWYVLLSVVASKKI
jgi:CDP-diacylglycerol--serine O-phosphatidyltransferase